ncbi:hypothetical protein CY34DRAFT_814198 [Suillus luteus UH-Slu-Lm8-n1]|uniref:Uncharacterized protein n=1 Tax=Suillus luteus UH-Slu-Lm8-n1 TaxID=930992 RepID=A0A0D0AED8_9AGAM|nr:hypothetical protein CY34DRAFT_814198 [Suillus luteus UH-Slu-Lm8-n1]
MDFEVKTHFELENKFCIHGHHADGLPVLQANAMVRTQDGESDLTLTPTTIDLSHDNCDKVQGASALSPLLFPHKEFQAATLVTQSKG